MGNDVVPEIVNATLDAEINFNGTPRAKSVHRIICPSIRLFDAVPAKTLARVDDLAIVPPSDRAR
ncbi:hypothetical protein [Stieleria mannarensis]|uniref:hypothetical protein n=1 Tax=Stieleria mannarensis TaxID=2755585 RepID=UPI001600701D|nr:hypothetical protein [Rhodopirellula sp. JC639]